MRTSRWSLRSSEPTRPTIDYHACQRARSLLARTPANRTKLYPNLTLEKAIERGSKQGKPTLSATTQGQYLATLKDILELAVLKRLIPHNPAQGVSPLKRETLGDAEKRRPFSLDQIIAFFTSDFYRSCAPGAIKPYNKPDREWRFWLPLICLFMGMRPNEVCQLLVADVTKTGTWHVDIASTFDDDEGEDIPPVKTIKTATSRRRVRIPPELIAIGFLPFVEARRKAMKNAPRLFPALKPDTYGNLATYALRRFREVFLPSAIKMEPTARYRLALVHPFSRKWKGVAKNEHVQAVKL